MIESVTKTFNHAFKRLNLMALLGLPFLMIGQTILLYLLYSWTGLNISWLFVAMIINLLLLVLGAVALFILQRFRDRLEKAVIKDIGAEVNQLRATNKRARSLQAMASTLSATLSFELVVEQALDVSSLTLAEMGVPSDSLLGAVFLYDGDLLLPLAKRHFLGIDNDVALAGKQGVVGTALRQGEPTVTDNPAGDPELAAFGTFRDCLTAVCIPLRAGFRLFGVMVLGTDTAVRFDDEHFDLFMSVADQTVIALQNAQLYQNLEAEKQRLITANETARKELARDLHDGPTQNVALIAMRLNYVRTILTTESEKAADEIEKIETLAKRTSRDIRSMLFTLRPLLLESQGLGAAVKSVMDRIQEADDKVEMRLIGKDDKISLDTTKQGVVFAIIEEALSNARKYAQANVVEVRLWQEEDLFGARITDDGVGFDPDEVRSDYNSRGSLGMINMQERAERIDGSLSIESAPGAGTTVTLVVPLTLQSQNGDAQPLLETTV